MYSVYMILNNVDKRKYIGITTNYRTRRNFHFCLGKTMPNRPLYRAIRQHGREQFLMVTLWETECKDEAYSIERGLIAAHNSHISKWGYNLSTGGSDGPVGFKHGTQK
jgi:predicted GIY-YIG superfamily endonuclease